MVDLESTPQRPIEIETRVLDDSDDTCLSICCCCVCFPFAILLWAFSGVGGLLFVKEAPSINTKANEKEDGTINKTIFVDDVKELTPKTGARNSHASQKDLGPVEYSQYVGRRVSNAGTLKNHATVQPEQP